MATVITLFVATFVVIEVTESASSAWISPDCLKAVRSGNRECLNKSNEEEIKVCGQRSALSANIAGGEDTVPGEWPWMARMIYERDDVLCGGTLVSDRHVVTAAHCLTRLPRLVRLGDSDLTKEYDCLEPGQCQGNLACYEGEQCAPRHLDIPIREHTNHERYKLCGDNSCFPQYDIALLTLDKIVTLSDFIRPLCLPELDTIQEETNLVVTGWGNTETEYGAFKQGDILQKLDLQSVPGPQCQVQWRDIAGMQDDLLFSHICATSNKAGQSTCRGDSGGPLARLADGNHDIWEMVGVVSFGVSRCGSAELPMGFTRIAGELNHWLRGLIDSDLPQRP